MRKSNRRDEERHRGAVRSFESESGPSKEVPDSLEPSGDGPRKGKRE